MYKIYINETPLILCTAEDISSNEGSASDDLVLRYTGTAKILLQVIDMLEKSRKYNSIAIYHTDLEVLFEDFKSLFKIIKAAGGLVFSDEGKLLVIYRRGFWDLPKGKIDRGESKKEAALREVAEETGLQAVQLVHRVGHTFHTYQQNGRRILKKTFWYKMITAETKVFPQYEEDIEAAAWVELSEFLNSDRKIYQSIKAILKMAQTMD